MSRSRSSVASSSTPSATTSNRSTRASSMVDCTMASLASSDIIAVTNDWSIFSRLTGSFWRYASELYPVP